MPDDPHHPSPSFTKPAGASLRSRLSVVLPAGLTALSDHPQVRQLRRLALNFRFRLHPVFEIMAILAATQLEQFKRALADALIQVNGGGRFPLALRFCNGHDNLSLIVPASRLRLRDSGTRR